MRDAIVAAIRDIVSDTSVSVTEESNLINDLGFDSVNMVQLIVALEDEFNIVFDDEDLDLEYFSDIMAIETVVARHVGK